MDASIIVALILSIVGNIINAWGMIYMKIGHELANAASLRAALQAYMDIRAAETSSEAAATSPSGLAKAKGKAADTSSADLSAGFLKQCKWWIGMATYGVGSLMHVASLGFGPAALLNPMEGLTLVANTMSAPPCLGEELTKYDIIGTVVIVAGTLVVVIFGPHNSEEYTADEILDRFGRTPFIVWSCCIWTITLVAYVIASYIEYINKRDGIQMDGSLKPRGAVFLALVYTNTKGVMGGYTMLFGKMFAEVAAESGEGDNQFTKWETYLFFVLFISFNVGMEYWRQKALNLFSTMYCVPLFQVTLVIFSVFTGAIFFSEFDELSTLYLILFLVGVVVICIGVVILSVVTESRKKVPPRLRLKASFLAVFAVCALKAMRNGKGLHKKGQKVADPEDKIIDLADPSFSAATTPLVISTPVNPDVIDIELQLTPRTIREAAAIAQEASDLKAEVEAAAAEQPMSPHEQKLKTVVPIG